MATQNAKDPGLSVPFLAELIVKGGWPALLDDEAATAGQALRDYLTQVSHVEVPLGTGRRRDPAKVGALIRSLARNTASEAAITTLAVDAARAEASLDRDTASAYRSALVRLMVVEDQPAWAPRCDHGCNCARLHVDISRIHPSRQQPCGHLRKDSWGTWRRWACCTSQW